MQARPGRSTSLEPVTTCSDPMPVPAIRSSRFGTRALSARSIEKTPMIWTLPADGSVLSSPRPRPRFATQPRWWEYETEPNAMLICGRQSIVDVVTPAVIPAEEGQSAAVEFTVRVESFGFSAIRRIYIDERDARTFVSRSEERRVGKESRLRLWPTLMKNKHVIS